MVETTMTETEEAAEAFSWVGEDGKFSEGWKEHLPEELRGEQTLDTFDDVPGAMKMLVHSQKQIGKNKVVLPTEVSTPEEVDEFYSKLGKPATAEDYKMDVPDELAGVMDADLISKAKELFHTMNLTESQAEALFEFDKARYVNSAAQVEAMEQQAVQEAEEALRNQWGAAYDERLHIANKVIADNTTEENRDEILAVVGNSPQVADFLANIGKKFMEGGITTGISTNTPTPAEALSKADELRSTPGYINGELYKSNPKMHAKITADIRRLTESALPEKG